MRLPSSHAGAPVHRCHLPYSSLCVPTSIIGPWRTPPPACFCLLRSQPCFFISPTTSERTPHVSGPFSGFFPPFPHFCDIPLFMTPVALVLTRLVLRALCFEGSFFGRAVSTSRISRRSSVSASPVPRERGETHASHGALSSIPLVPHLGGRDRPSVTSSLKTEYQGV